MTITDLSKFQNLINKNITENKSLIRGSAKFQTLEWGKDLEIFEKEKFQCILMSDCIYYDEVRLNQTLNLVLIIKFFLSHQSLSPLILTLNRLCDKDTKIICCFERRDTEHKKALEKKFFTVCIFHKQNKTFFYFFKMYICITIKKK